MTLEFEKIKSKSNEYIIIFKKGEVNFPILLLDESDLKDLDEARGG